MAASDVSSKFAPNSFFESLRPILVRLKTRFDERGETLAFAESCTGGLLSAAVASLPGASTFYLGGVISYHRAVKNKILQVSMPLIQTVGEVSESVALAMAKGSRDVTGANWAVSVSGIAGPGGGTVEKPVGMVCFAFVGPGVAQTATKYFSPDGPREQIQQASVEFALETLMVCG